MSYDTAVTVVDGSKEWLQIQCLTARREGKSFGEIAQELSLPEKTVRRNVSDALKAFMAPLVAELRGLELARLEEMHSKVWPLALDGNLRAIDRVLNISKARRELMGLDRPVGENDDDTGSSHTIIEIFASPEPNEGGALSTPSKDVASQDPSDRTGGRNGSRQDVAGSEVAVLEAQSATG